MTKKRGLSNAARQFFVAAGRKGGLRGGKARAAALTPERRQEIARIAVNARWNKNAEDLK